MESDRSNTHIALLMFTPPRRRLTIVAYLPATSNQQPIVELEMGKEG